MRHYEIVFLVHLDQSEQVPAMIERYRSIIAERSGVLHRLEDWRRRVLAYPIQKAHKAHYVLMNVECDAETLRQLESAFRFNDAVLRSLVIRRHQAITEPSPLAGAGKDDETAEDAETQDEAAKKTARAAPAADGLQGSRGGAADAEEKVEEAAGEPPADSVDHSAEAAAPDPSDQNTTVKQED